MLDTFFKNKCIYVYTFSSYGVYTAFVYTIPKILYIHLIIFVIFIFCIYIIMIVICYDFLSNIYILFLIYYLI